MNFLLEMLEKGLATPFHAIAKKQELPALAPVTWSIPQGKSERYCVGMAKEDITPPDLRKHLYYMAGYGMYKPIRGVLNPIYASALWLDDNTGSGGVLLLSVDCVGIMNNDVEAIRKRLAPFCRITGCRAVNLMSTHCHASVDTMGFWGPLPKSGRDKRFFSLLFDQIEKAAYAAYKSRKDGDLYAGSVKAEGIQDDKRLPHVFEDTLTRLRFVPKNGGQEIYIVNFAAHPEVLGSRNVLLSADYVHYLRKKIEKERNAKFIYFNGAVGGMITPLVEDHSDLFESTKIAGERIADAVLSVKKEHKLTPCIRTARKELYIELSNSIFALCGLLKVMPRKRYASETGPLGINLKSELNYLEIGDIHILMVPGELFPELAYGGYLEADVAAAGGPDMNPKPLREIANDPNLIIFGLANDEIGYIMPPNDYILDEDLPFLVKTIDQGGRRHYEEINSTGPKTAHTLANAFTEILEARPD